MHAKKWLIGKEKRGKIINNAIAIKSVKVLQCLQSWVWQYVRSWLGNKIIQEMVNGASGDISFSSSGSVLIIAN